MAVAIIVAAGRGERLGDARPKAFVMLGGKPMVAHVVERLRPQVMDLVVVANDPDPDFSRLGVPVIADPPDIQRAARQEGRRLGPLAGILAGMECALKHHPHAGWILSPAATRRFRAGSESSTSTAIDATSPTCTMARRSASSASARHVANAPSNDQTSGAPITSACGRVRFD